MGTHPPALEVLLGKEWGNVDDKEARQTKLIIKIKGCKG